VNVYKLDLIFQSDKVNCICDEVGSRCIVLETSINQALQAFKRQSRAHSSSLNKMTCMLVVVLFENGWAAMFHNGPTIGEHD